MVRIVLTSLIVLAAAGAAVPVDAQIEPAPDRERGEGPYEQLILRAAIVVDGTGAPPMGPTDIVIERERIVDIVGFGPPGLPIDPDNRPELADGGTEIDLERAWVRDVAERGADGIKFFGARPDILFAAIDEAGRQRLGTAI